MKVLEVFLLALVLHSLSFPLAKIFTTNVYTIIKKGKIKK